MKKANLVNSASSVAATLAGGMSSRLVADVTPINNAKLKHASLALVASLGSVFLNRKSPMSAFTQDVAVGFAATQFGYLIKQFLGEDSNENLVKALGNPMTSDDAIQFLASYNNYDFIPASKVEYVGYEEMPREITFRQ